MNYTYNRIIVSVMMLMGIPFTVLNAQKQDSISVDAAVITSIAGKDYQPLWLVANQFAAVSDQHADLSGILHANYTHLFYNKKKKRNVNDSMYFSQDVAGSASAWFAQCGATLINNAHFKETFFQEAYIRAGYGKFEIRAGRYKNIVGEVDKELSSGSLATSGNALPIPMVSVALSNYVAVPFTNGWLQFKGSFSHGWFGNNRYMKDAWLHEKTLYLRLGKQRLKLFAGIVHDAEWAGRRGNKQLERSWKGFWEVVTVKEADDGSVGGPATLLPNRPGDQRGILEFGAEYEAKKMRFHFYHQTPFESGQGIDIRNIDRLAGLSVQLKNPHAFLQKLLGEFIYTKQMENYYASRYAQTYYNNGFYKTGWEYEDRIIGTPLFVNRHRGQNYFNNITPFNWNDNSSSAAGNQNILYVRVIGGHVGAITKLADNKHFSLLSKTMLTYTQSFKNRSSVTPIKQFYSLEKLTAYFKQPKLELSLALGFDNGDFTKNTGAQLGITWHIMGK